MTMSPWSSFGLQEAISPIMELMITFHDYMIVILFIILSFVFYIFVLVLRSYSTDKYILDAHTLELVWTVVPMIFLVFMAFPSLYILYMTEDSISPSITLKILGHQWYWEYEYTLSSKTFQYDSYILSSSSENTYRCLDVDNRVCVPSNSLTLALVTSSDVLHSWTVPSLGVKADATPGRLNALNLNPISSGVFYGQCRELCGSNHSFMPIVVESLSPAGFTLFLDSFIAS